MIEAIAKIPDDILKGQSERRKESNVEPEYLIIFLDKNFEIKKTERGKFSEICTKNVLTPLQKNLILKFKDYIGATDFGDLKYGRKGFGGQFGLFTCSLLHYNFANNTFESIIRKRDIVKAENTLKAIDDDKKEEVQILNKYTEIKLKLTKILLNFFINTVPKKEEMNFNISFKADNEKIIFIPESDEFIETYNKFHKEYLLSKSGKIGNEQELRFDLDTSEKYDKQLHQLYSKFGRNKTVIQDESCNKIQREIAEKIGFFKRILGKSILPLPLFYVQEDSNIYASCFSSNSLLKKLKDIYSQCDNKPFNYLLISNFDGYRFERVIHFNFDISDIINQEVYSLKFNNFKVKNEIITIQNKQRKHDKFELLFDISLLFWNLNVEKSETKEMSFFNSKIKNNLFLNQLLIENSESIVSQIFKQNNTFIRDRLFILINNLLKGTFRAQEIKERYESSFQMRRLLLIYFKYEVAGKMVLKIKEIEKKMDEFLRTNNLDEFENDEITLYLAGQIINYLLSNTSYGGSKLELMTKYLLSVNSIEQLKKRICDLTSKYSHNIYDNERWRTANKRFLEYEFKNQNFKQNLIPFFTGFYAENVFFAKIEKNNGGGK